MKILHTSDWHLGKKLEGYSRIEEQEKFLEELKEICNREKIQVILIAGDVYDSSNPPVEAEKLYFKAIKDLSNNGDRLIIVIAGNHDNPEKLLASTPFSSEYGIITFGKPLEVKELGQYGKWEVIESFEGGILVKKDEEELFINALPYPSEKELNELLSDNSKEYSERIGEILTQTHSHKKKDTKSIIISHLFTLGATKEGSERDIDLGGSVYFDLNYAPKADYIALGHIHKPMNFDKNNAYYCGSPIEYRVSENTFDKKVLVKNLDTGEMKDIFLTNHKAIKSYTTKSIEEALEVSEKLMDKNEWIYLYIESDRPLKNHETRDIKKNKNIIEIIPKINWLKEDDMELSHTELNISDSFKNYYKSKNNVLPNEELLKIFLSIIGELEHETN